MIKSVQWLQTHLTDKNLVVLDGSLVAKKKRMLQIPKSRFFDLPGKFSDKSSMFPNTMPSSKQFQREARNLGISNESIIVVYDNVGIYSAPRVWYMFKSMGHQDVFVLDGGLPEWENHEFEVETIQAEIYEQGDFNAEFKYGSFKTTDDINTNIDNAKEKLIDARSSGRFNGTSPEPRAELKSGCIPGSVSLPFSEVVENGKFKSKEELQAIFQDSEPKIFTCGSGLTACINLLAAEIADDTVEKSVYDGSWTEWAMTHGLMVS